MNRCVFYASAIESMGGGYGMEYNFIFDDVSLTTVDGKERIIFNSIDFYGNHLMIQLDNLYSFQLCLLYTEGFHPEPKKYEDVIAKFLNKSTTGREVYKIGLKDCDNFDVNIARSIRNAAGGDCKRVEIH